LALVRIAAIGVAPAGATGATFDITHYNLCSRHCSYDHVYGATKTHFGVTPVNEMLWTIGSRGREPRAISLNEVCVEAWWTAVAGLPSYYNTYFLAARNFSSDPGCVNFGNLISVRSLGNWGALYHCFTDGNGSAPGCAPTIDDQGEYRLAICTKSEIYLEVFAACTAHVTGSSQATTYRSVVDGWFGSSPRLALGDLNVYNSVPAFPNNGYTDAFAGLNTFVDEDMIVRHIDYGYLHQDDLDGPDTDDNYAGSSDHHLLFAGIHFK
jgi:hypothetical protein